MELGIIEIVPVRDIWPSEPGNFTPWLAENITYLSKEIGKDLEIIQTEYSVGDFSVDILASDLGSKSKVVIENQYGPSDHKHLGQTILYCAGINASCMIWIAESFKPEHKKAIEWMNSNTVTEIEFYAIELKIIRIDNSRPVPIFSIVQAPTKIDNTNESSISSDQTETKSAYKKYFQLLIDELREIHKFTNAKAGQPQNWYTFASEQSKVFKYGTSFALNDRVRVEIYIDTGDKAKNKEIFDNLQRNKEKIESEFGNSLSWERLDDKRSCRIALYRDGSISDDSETLLDIRNWAIQNLLTFRKVFPKYIMER